MRRSPACFESRKRLDSGSLHVTDQRVVSHAVRRTTSCLQPRPSRTAHTVYSLLTSCWTTTTRIEKSEHPPKIVALLVLCIVARLNLHHRRWKLPRSHQGSFFPCGPITALDGQGSALNRLFFAAKSPCDACSLPRSLSVSLDTVLMEQRVQSTRPRVQGLEDSIQRSLSGQSPEDRIWL